MTGAVNTALRRGALFSNSSGFYNSAIGEDALYSNTDGWYNTASGNSSLENNTSGDYNTAMGYYTLDANTTGKNNTAMGSGALGVNTTGDYNTAMGNSAFGSVSASAYSNSATFGYDAEPGGSNRIMLGNSGISWIGGHSTWHNTSDASVKNNINEDVKGLDFIMGLRPVTYHFDIDKMNELIGVTDSSDYTGKYDKERIKQSGFLAQEVKQAALNSGYDFSGVCTPKGDVKYYSLAYAEFVVPLVKAVQEQQEIIEVQQAEINAMEAQNKALKTKNDEVDVKIMKKYSGYMYEDEFDDSL